MKTRILAIPNLIPLLLLFALINSCKKEMAPSITTSSISNITAITATSGGSITDEGNSTITSRGVCWSTATTPTISDSKTTDGLGVSSYSSSLTGLNAVTVYYVRAYATNSVGTGYGTAISFRTLGQTPTPTIAAATFINVTTATLNGTVNANYLSTIVTFEYGTTTSYGSTVTASQSPITGAAVTIVNSDITGLTYATIYHYRLKAVNSLGITYSDDFTFTTLGLVPTVTTSSATNLNLTSATLNGSVNANYLSTVVTFEYGTTTSYGSTATATQSPLSSSSNTNVSSSITGLSGGTTYHFRVSAVNSLGTSYGNDMTFISGQVPTVSTFAATNVSLTGATMNGSVNSNYLSTVVSFEYGTTISYGSSSTVSQSPVLGNTNTNVNVDIIGLMPGTVYHYRLKAENSIGTSYGSDLVLTTLGQVPTVTSLAATNINLTGATLNGSINSNFLSTAVTFEYGTTTSYGNIATVTQSPLTGNSVINVSSDITGLMQLTTYHYRIKAVNSLGTSYGIDFTFLTKYAGTVTDVNGNTYNTLSIGTQVWMKENLKATNFSNGDLIGTTTPATLNISGESTPKYQWAYDGDESKVATYGRLYTWFAATDNRKVCPTGWHVPSLNEWQELHMYLSYVYSENNTAKSMASTSGWTTSGTPGTVGNDQASNNSSGFTALPGGIRWGNTFQSIVDWGEWWSSTDSGTDSGIHYSPITTIIFSNNKIGVGINNIQDSRSGNSIRCLRDN
jgi:uncharacterized protein (TIGR02145 family)